LSKPVQVAGHNHTIKKASQKGGTLGLEINAKIGIYRHFFTPMEWKNIEPTPLSPIGASSNEKTRTKTISTGF
jgi:hypothetical protein